MRNRKKNTGQPNQNGKRKIEENKENTANPVYPPKPFIMTKHH